MSDLVAGLHSLQQQLIQVQRLSDEDLRTALRNSVQASATQPPEVLQEALLDEFVGMQVTALLNSVAFRCQRVAERISGPNQEEAQISDDDDSTVAEDVGDSTGVRTQISVRIRPASSQNSGEPG